MRRTSSCGMKYGRIDRELIAVRYGGGPLPSCQSTVIDVTKYLPHKQGVRAVPPSGSGICRVERTK